MNSNLNDRSLLYQVPTSSSNESIDLMRVRLADCPPPCPAHRPHIVTFSPRRLALRRLLASFRPITYVEEQSRTDSYPTSASVISEEDIKTDAIPLIVLDDSDDSVIIIEPDNFDDQTSHQTLDHCIEEQLNQCQRCSMLIQILDNQAHQIEQHRQHISEQASLLAEFDQYFAGTKEEIKEHMSDHYRQFHD